MRTETTSDKSSVSLNSVELAFRRLKAFFDAGKTTISCKTTRVGFEDIARIGEVSPSKLQSLRVGDRGEKGLPIVSPSARAVIFTRSGRKIFIPDSPREALEYIFSPGNAEKYAGWNEQRDMPPLTRALVIKRFEARIMREPVTAEDLRDPVRSDLLSDRQRESAPASPSA